MSARRNQVFISYSHHDKAWLERLQVHLRPLVRDGLIERWDDERIQAGRKWREEIRQALASSKVAVLLVSADFLASDFVVTEELLPLLTAAETEGILILPVILSPSRFEQTPLAQFQAVNPPSRPLVSLPKGEQEAFFLRVADAVEQALSSPSTSRKQAADNTEPSASRATSTGDGPRSGGGVVAWLRQNKEWAFFGIGIALLVMLFSLLFSLSKPEQTQDRVKAEYGIAVDGDLDVGDSITIVGPQPASRKDDARKPAD